MNECCEHNENGCKWGVGCNMPGYMPDSDVAHYETFEAALEGHLGDIEEALEYDEESDVRAKRIFDEYEALARNHPAQERSIHIGNYVYWIAQIA